MPVSRPFQSLFDFTEACGLPRVPPATNFTDTSDPSDGPLCELLTRAVKLVTPLAGRCMSWEVSPVKYVFNVAWRLRRSLRGSVIYYAFLSEYTPSSNYAGLLAYSWLIARFGLPEILLKRVVLDIKLYRKRVSTRSAYGKQEPRLISQVQICPPSEHQRKKQFQRRAPQDCRESRRRMQQGVMGVWPTAAFPKKPFHLNATADVFDAQG